MVDTLIYDLMVRELTYAIDYHAVVFSPDCFALFRKETTRLLAERASARPRQSGRDTQASHDRGPGNREPVAGDQSGHSDGHDESGVGEARSRAAAAVGVTGGGEAKRLKKTEAFLQNGKRAIVSSWQIWSACPNGTWQRRDRSSPPCWRRDSTHADGRGLP